MLRSSYDKHGCGTILTGTTGEKYLKDLDMKLSLIYIFITLELNSKFYNMNEIRFINI